MNVSNCQDTDTPPPPPPPRPLPFKCVLQSLSNSELMVDCPRWMQKLLVGRTDFVIEGDNVHYNNPRD